MKIRDIKTFTVDCFRTNWVFVKVYTDSGVDGVGEATLEYKEKALAASANVCKILPAKLGDSIGDYAALSVAAMNRKNG